MFGFFLTLNPFLSQTINSMFKGCEGDRPRDAALAHHTSCTGRCMLLVEYSQARAFFRNNPSIGRRSFLDIASSTRSSQLQASQQLRSPEIGITRLAPCQEILEISTQSPVLVN